MTTLNQTQEHYISAHC